MRRTGRLPGSAPWAGSSRPAATALLAGVLLLGGCGSADDDPEPSAGTVLDPVSARRALLDPTDRLWTEAAPDSFDAAFVTSEGEFVVRVRRDWAPVGADRFFNLARAGYFDDSRFFRVVADFIAQFGIPGDPEVTRAWQGRTMPDDPVRSSNVRGALAYAMTGPDTRQTQIYINLVDNVRLDSTGFAPFGSVVSGMDVVDGLYAGYGENAGGGMRRGQQDRMLNEGNAHLDAEYPELSRILRVEIR